MDLCEDIAVKLNTGGAGGVGEEELPKECDPGESNWISRTTLLLVYFENERSNLISSSIH